VRAVVVSAAVALGLLAGCGGDSKKPASTTQALSGPVGRLTLDEYRAIVREYRELRPLQQSQDDAAALAKGRTACARLRDPRTALVARVRHDCNNAIRFFISLSALDKAGADCTSGSDPDRIRCARARYARMAQAIRTTTAGGIAINEELRRRRIHGVCADSIGMTGAQIAAYRSAEQAARDAVDAIAAGDPLGFEHATSQLTAALDAGSAGDPLTGIVHACRPVQPKATPRSRRPQPKSKPKRKQKTKPLPGLPGGGINA
jgi:hypothetical protein